MSVGGEAARGDGFMNEVNPRIRRGLWTVWTLATLRVAPQVSGNHALDVDNVVAVLAQRIDRIRGAISDQQFGFSHASAFGG